VGAQLGLLRLALGPLLRPLGGLTFALCPLGGLSLGLLALTPRSLQILGCLVEIPPYSSLRTE